MKQERFIFMANNVQPLSMVQDPNGNTIVKLREEISIIHNYHNEYMVLSVASSKYKVMNEAQLETVFRMHLENKDLFQLLHEYAETNFDKV